MKIILIRHGQTEWNALHKYQGHTDIQLNELGRQQAARAAQYLKEQGDVEALYASDLSRTRETAEIIGTKINLPVITDTRLRELFFGLWEGMTFSEVLAEYREEFDNWHKNTAEFKVPGGESFNELVTRSGLALQEIAANHNGTVVVVTHGGVIMATLYYLKFANDLWQVGVEPGSISSFGVEKGTMRALGIGLCI